MIQASGQDVRNTLVNLLAPRSRISGRNGWMDEWRYPSCSSTGYNNMISASTTVVQMPLNVTVNK